MENDERTRVRESRKFTDPFDDLDWRWRRR